MSDESKFAIALIAMILAAFIMVIGMDMISNAVDGNANGGEG